jgi:hypothetical protein
MIDPDTPDAKLALLLRQFIQGTHTSIAHVNRIEATVEQYFANDPRFERLALAAAKYRPGGGDQLIDSMAMERVCRAALRELESRQA